MNNEVFIKKIEEFFGVYENGQIVELETWTDGGVNMHIVLGKDSESSYLKQFEDYLKGFDVDEEIELHRQDIQYKNDFTIRESLEDFEAYDEWLSNVYANIK